MFYPKGRGEPSSFSNRGITQSRFHFWKITVVLGRGRAVYFSRCPGGATRSRPAVPREADLDRSLSHLSHRCGHRIVLGSEEPEGTERRATAPASGPPHLRDGGALLGSLNTSLQPVLGAESHTEVAENWGRGSGSERTS